LRRGLTVFAEFFRNVPDYILLIWLFVALPVFLSNMLGQRIIFVPTITAIASLSLSYSVYFAETLRAGFQSTPPGQTHSAQALGMMPGTILLRILIPQILMRTSPELMNVCISLFKTTSIVSLIAVPDLMYQISNMSSQIMRPVPLYTGGALIYVAIIVVASLGLRWYTRRLHASRI
ncbi:MAG TPA: ABC transporter permease subunit, partial [Rhizobium sp.]